MPTMYSWLTHIQLQLIQRYFGTKDNKIEAMLDYLNRNEVVGPEIFPYLKLPNIHEFCYTPVPRDVFIRRLPIYLHGSEEDEEGRPKYLDTVDSYASKIYLEHRNDYVTKLESFYSTVERMHYHHGISLENLFHYPTDQTGQVGRVDTLLQWGDYLDLAEKYGIPEKTPKHLIVDYNYLLERDGRAPLIYYLEEQYNYDYVWRTQDIIEVQGIFPCDTAGNPIWRWLGLRVKDATSIRLNLNHRLKGTMQIKINPRTAIWGLNCYNSKDDDEDYWYLLYAGPLLMEFDFQKLKKARQYNKMTQKEVAEAIGAAVRTYQKWENGDTTPDCRYLLRLMNLFDIKDTAELTSIEVEMPVM